MRIVIQGNPIPKARARTVQRGQKTITFDPQHEEKQHVRHQFMKAMREAFDSEKKEISMEASNLTYGKLFHLSVTFYLPLNDSDSEAEKNAKLWGLEPCNKKPDLSNMLKFYEDAANGVLYLDDSMIVSCVMSKRFDEKPRTEIDIMCKKELKVSEKAEGILKIFGPSKLKEFLTDVLLLARLHPNEVDETDRGDREVWLTSAACLLSDFAIKYAEPLKKVRKYDGVVEETDAMNLAMIGIESGVFNINQTK